MLTLIILIVLVILIIGSVPAYPYSRNWGYTPGGALAAILVIPAPLAVRRTAVLTPRCTLQSRPIGRCLRRPQGGCRTSRARLHFKPEGQWRHVNRGKSCMRFRQ